MSLRSRLLRLLERGPAPDPDEFVDLAAVPLAVGPMMLHRLHDAGIDARGNEAFNPATSVRSDYRIRVRRRDLERALEVTND